jgi:hypothetical protein
LIYDIFFICYDESNREKNWQRLLEFHNNAKKISGINGIAEAHLTCDKLSTTEKFWTVDGDNWLLEPLVLDYEYQQDLLFFKAIDSIDNTVSSIGAVKLWKKSSFINKDMSKGDFCKNATETSLVVNKTFSVHDYATAPEEAWRHTFRHLVKSLSGIIGKTALQINLDRMEKHKSLNQYSYRGYLDAIEYVKECNGDFDKLNLINDYDWLKSKCPKEM